VGLHGPLRPLARDARRARRAADAVLSGPGTRSGREPGGDVVVVGAGLAGLRAAADLVAAGLDVVVVEARDRVGGRVWTHRFADGQWCERGAEFVDGAHTAVLDLAAELGVETVDVVSGRDDDARLLDAGGRALPVSLHHSVAGDVARWQEALDALAATVDPDDPAGGGEAASLDALALSELLAGLGLGVMARVAIGRDIRTEHMRSPDEVSQLMAGWTAALHRRSGGGFEAHRLAGGNDQLATGLATRLGDRVRLGATVRRIDPAAGSVELDAGDVLRARHLVVTLPLPVLGRVWDDMPAELARVGYGIGGKVSVQVARRIWHDSGLDGSVRSERAWGEMWETTDRQPGDAGVLTALLSSDDGAALLALPDGEERVVREMDRLFPGVAGLAGDRVRTDWTNDPCSLGTYATFGPGQLVPAWPVLQRAHGRMVLAGEHTDAFTGYMEGALRSGARAARRVIELTARR